MKGHSSDAQKALLTVTGPVAISYNSVGGCLCSRIRPSGCTVQRSPLSHMTISGVLGPVIWGPLRITSGVRALVAVMANQVVVLAKLTANQVVDLAKLVAIENGRSGDCQLKCVLQYY